MNKTVQSFLTSLLILLSAGLIFAQNYLDIPPDPNFSKDYLNRIIYGDTTDTGERIPDRVYRLEIGGIYYFNNIIKTDGWDLKIVAEGTPTAEFSKAIILTGKNDQGKQPARFAEVHGDVLFKNLYFSCVTEDDKQMLDVIRVYKDSANVTFENCYFEWPKLHVARMFASNTSLYVKDCYFRNITVVGGPFNGKIANFEDNPVNEIIFQNNTIVNVQGITFKIRFNTVKYFKFDHNTVVNTIKWPFHFEYWTNGEVTNNIFFNASSYGENTKDASNQDLDGLMFGIINLYEVPDSLLAQVGLSSQSERRMEVRNNIHYYDDKVKAYIDKWWALDSVKIEPWMNERTQSWFDDDTNFPYLNNENVINEDPGFVDYPVPDSMIKKMDQWRTDGKKTTWWWVDDDGDKVGNATDRPNDLSYPTSSIAYTAADGGFPLGDLNWFPDKKAEWEATAIDDRNSQVAKQFSLEQNYPNPFNPTTRIDYSLPQSAQVKLIVFNILGQKVRTLVNSKMNAGKHHVVWNGRDDAGRVLPSGVYYYQLDLDGTRITRKMVLMK